ncbi:MAG: protein kinase [Gemmatimonadales bacterium]|jgi:serine/threonine-protein kinase
MTDIVETLNTALSDRYRIERELGAGGMATVYLAEDLKHERKVALKVLKPELAAVLGADRFVQEIKTTASLQHPHILPLFDSGSADGFLYYVMPYIEGETLREKLDRETQLGVDEAIRITTEVADALDYAHRNGVIHRDIKPENILLHDGRPMVADFGIALAVSAAAGGRMTETGLSLGTPHYMSPEQATAEKEITNRSDVYSLACVTYEMLAGDPPHTGSTAQQIIMKIVTEEATAVTNLRKSVPPNVAAALAKALEKLPADRFESAAAFAEALTDPSFRLATAAAGGRPVAAAERRGRWALPFAAVAVVALVVAALGWFRRPEPAASIRYRVALSGRPLPAGLVGRHLAMSPDGRTIVFSDVVDGERQLWIKTADRTVAEPLSGTADGRAPAFSPDGEWIAFVADRTLKRVPRGGGSAVTIADSANSAYSTVAWLEDGTIAFNDRAYGLRVIGEDGGPERRWTWVDSLGMGVVSVTGLPDGRGALVGLCTVGCPTSALLALDLKTGEAHELSETVSKAWHVPDGRVVFARPDGGVFAVPFDLGSLEFKSAPVPVLDGVRSSLATVDMALAADGTLLFVRGEAVAGGEPVEAVWVTRDGVATPVDSGWAFLPSGNGGIALSPDGQRLALAIQASGSDDIWIKELDHGPFTRLTFDGSNVRPVWSADGRFVLYMSQPEEGSVDVRRRRSDGTLTPETVLDATRAVWQAFPTPDTSLMVVRLGVPPTRDVYLFEPELTPGDSAITPLIANSNYEETSIALSPDGGWLAYASNESGRYEVYVRPFPEVDAGRWQVSRDGGNEPLWAHSGRELFYRSGTGDLIAVTVQPGPGFRTGEQRVLFSASGYLSNASSTEYDITPDDRRFVFKRQIGTEEHGTETLTAVLVQNWLSELDGRGSGGR